MIDADGGSADPASSAGPSFCKFCGSTNNIEAGCCVNQKSCIRRAEQRMLHFYKDWVKPLPKSERYTPERKRRHQAFKKFEALVESVGFHVVVSPRRPPLWKHIGEVHEAVFKAALPFAALVRGRRIWLRNKTPLAMAMGIHELTHALEWAAGFTSQEFSGRYLVERTFAERVGVLRTWEQWHDLMLVNVQNPAKYRPMKVRVGKRLMRLRPELVAPGTRVIARGSIPKRVLRRYVRMWTSKAFSPLWHIVPLSLRAEGKVIVPCTTRWIRGSTPPPMQEEENPWTRTTAVFGVADKRPICVNEGPEDPRGR